MIGGCQQHFFLLGKDYRLQDIELLNGVKVLLHDQGFTTKGVQKIFSDHGASYVSDIGRKALTGEAREQALPVTLDRPKLEAIIARATALRSDLAELRLYLAG